MRSRSTRATSLALAVVLGVTANDLAAFDKPVKRHDNTDAPPPKDCPKKGHIGFQHLSRENEPIEIRGAKIRELK